MKDIFNYNPKKWYELVKTLSGQQIINIDFQLDEPSIKTAHQHPTKIVQALPPLSTEALESIPHSQDENLPRTSPENIKKKINNLKRTSTCPSNIPIILVKAFADKLSLLLAEILCSITESGCYPDI